ncbi:GAF domain-containing protein [Leptothermofonsia sichuanensis E412]|uniref:GAF domain-containing protein n=1 Tax=Leptothermofonsia sichuanensis TaxID=2917832 RepID=UPI001CA77EF0|nr:GAF domain-containing protein [Leptothermofonsia sichuanensis]QZZ22505.1 GAF domain-containing protein [Leptothermofonsia sichuanensis E412]
MVNQTNAASDMSRFQPIQPVWNTPSSSSISTELTAQLPITPNPKQKVSVIQKFSDLPVGRKQFIALLVCQLVPILGFSVGTILMLTSQSKTQLLDQATSEVAILEANYNLKVDQLGLSARGLANNSILINAAKAQIGSGELRPELQEQVREILRKEMQTHQLEYVTLVSKDLRIIGNANANRQGETFDPNGLVSAAMRNGQQIKASAIAPWSELMKESVSLPTGFTNRDALIRYVITPVTDPNTQDVIGSLVVGILVNNTLAVLGGTTSSLGDGYSGVYFRQPNGQFGLATALNNTALDKGNVTQESSRSNISISDPFLLKAAAAAPKGETVTGQVTIDGVPYTVAAKAAPNRIVETANGAFPAYSRQPAAILVRGIPNERLYGLLRASLVQQGTALFVGLVMVLFCASVLRRTVTRPLQDLERATLAFARGDRTARAEVSFKDEVGRLATLFNYLTDRIADSEQALTLEAERQRHQIREAQLLSDVIVNIRRSIKIEDIMRTSVNEIRQFMGVERVLLYRFNDDYKSGTITAESVAPGWVKALGQTIHDPLSEDALDRFNSGRVSFINNWEEAKLNNCYCEILERLQVKANMVVPIKSNNKLFGLLCAHSCSSPREWKESELDFLGRLGAQIGYALDQADLLERQKEESRLSRLLNEITLSIRENFSKESILNTTVREMRRVLNADRVVVYQFNSDMTGTIIAEAISLGWLPLLGETVTDPFREGLVDQYRNGRIRVMNDIYAEGLTECHRELLEGFQIRASITAPFLHGSRLMGLLCIHQCSDPREWKEAEINFVQQLSNQLGFAIEQAILFEEKEKSRLQAETILQEQRQQQETLQRQLVSLLGDVEGVAMGDLTVRADVTAGDIGTVADFFNSIVESLRQIVTQVKQSALHVNMAISEHESAIRELAKEALRQAQETTLTLDSVEQMTHSIRAVAENARQAAEVTRTASSTAEAGGAAMDLTVQNILTLRDTIGETAKKVKRLGESSQQISKVVSLINQIALQTNLLAINAGIEAARAGEEGQGFAVVAEEVGELAARSAAATREIEQIVETIQRETSEVVEAMEQGTTQVVEGTYLVGNARQSLEQIMMVSRQIDSLVQSISEATVSQVQTSQTISSLMEEVAQVAERTSNSSLQVSDSLRQTVAIARELQKSVETFKVG